MAKSSPWRAGFITAAQFAAAMTIALWPSGAWAQSESQAEFKPAIAQKADARSVPAKLAAKAETALASEAGSEDRAAQKSSQAALTPMDIKQIIRRESPAIVAIISVDEQGKPLSYGTGFVVRPNGVVVTNYHVVEGAHDAQIKFVTSEIYENVRVLAFDQRRDLIILKIVALNRPTVTLGDSATVEQGDHAYAIGNPEGLFGTPSEGMIGPRRMLEGTELIQHSVPISHGSSGGPLYNIYGQVIGVTSAAITEEGAQNLNFAVPIKYVLELLESPSLNLALWQLPGHHAPPPPQPTPQPTPPQPAGPIQWEDPSGWMGITLPAGWRIENPPPENTFLAASKGEVATLLGIRTDSKNADDAFERMKKVASDNFGKLVNFSEKIKLDPADGRHARMQTFQLSSGGSAYLFIGGLQHGPRVIALLGVFKGTDVYNEFVDSLKTISW